MPVPRSGLFTQEEFVGRNILKLAPDAFVSINGALGARVISPAKVSGNQNLEVRGGVSSITVNAAIKPAGATRATIEVIAPQYKGLHEDYYVTMPNGTRIPYFVPMMEIKVFMKGRFLDPYTNNPVYYPVFWGLILDVTENYSGGVHTFSLNCGDILHWWKWQKITVRPADSSGGFVFGAPTNWRVPTVFERMNPWEIIVALFMDNFFQNEGSFGALYNFVYMKLSKSGVSPDFGAINRGDAASTFGGLAQQTVKYWDQRFGFNFNNATDPNKVPVEIYGMRKQLSVSSIMERVNLYRESEKAKRRSDILAEIDLDESILGKIQPFGSLDLYGDGGEPLIQAKLDIANEVVEQTQMEFFVDTNGTIVFKPPFYNMDVVDPAVPEYTLAPQDVINFSASLNSDNIVNYLECTSPQHYDVPNAVELIGYHIDYESIKRFGLRTKSIALRYGNTSRSLRLIAAAEMSRVNGTAFSGSASIPLRPEIRLGYPVYIKHIDAYYYVTGITHSFSFGSGATTDLSLEMRRDRVFDGGEVTGVPGTVLKSKVYRYKYPDNESTKGSTNDSTGISINLKSKDPVDQKIQKLNQELQALRGSGNAEEQQKIESLINEQLKIRAMRQSKILDGPATGGLYEVSDAANVPTDHNIKIGSDPTYIVQKITSNELLMVTDETVPYTDINGYRHIGGFPYGANLKLTTNLNLRDLSDSEDNAALQVEAQIGTDATRTRANRTRRVTLTPEEEAKLAEAEATVAAAGAPRTAEEAIGSLQEQINTSDANAPASSAVNIEVQEVNRGDGEPTQETINQIFGFGDTTP
ncbi:MAG: hypothetical protein GF334_00915 [Candidatus Altiarchaeales archaeon]|nr:hypothetical protein [Candidatus Altiarchaeales archaeon]